MASTPGRFEARSARTSTDDLDMPAEAYVGAAEVSTGSTTGDGSTTGEDAIPVDVQLRGHVEPLDGFFHWYGRIDANDVLAARHRSGSTVTLTTPHGSAHGRLSDVDPWGRFRISGTGRPPF
jgi:hypothetical protein